MNWLKTIGYGIILFALMFLIGSIAMFTFKMVGTTFSVTMLIAGIIVLWLLAMLYKIPSAGTGFQVGLIWLIVDALLEYFILVQTFNKGNLSFYSWSVLTGYALVILIPMLVGSLSKKS
jgi:hypothetical protein